MQRVLSSHNTPPASSPSDRLDPHQVEVERNDSEHLLRGPLPHI